MEPPVGGIMDAERRLQWSTGSKAADKSNSINAAESPRSTACSKSEILAGRRFQLNGLVESRTAVTVGGRQMTGTASAGVQRDVPCS